MSSEHCRSWGRDAGKLGFLYTMRGAEHAGRFTIVEYPNTKRTTTPNACRTNVYEITCVDPRVDRARNCSDSCGVGICLFQQ